MKVVITVPWGERLGGAETMLWSLLQHLDTDRFGATLVFFERGSFAEETAALGFRSLVVPIGRLREPHRVVRTVRALARLLERESPDVMLNWVAKAQIYGALAATAAGLPGSRILWWQHGIPAGHWMDRLASALPAAAVGCSSTTAAREQATIWPRRPTFVVHPGVEPAEETGSARGELPVAADCTVVGMVGRLQPWKGQHRLLLATRALLDRGFDIHALVVGGDAHGLSPEYVQRLESLIDELGLAGNVTMTGHVPDPSPWWRAMDIAVSASEREPFGIVLLEAMAHGLPVVAVGDAGPRDIVEPDVTGALVSSPTPEAIAAALEPLVADPERRRRLGAAGRERATRYFTADHMAARIQERLEAAATAAGGPR